MTAKAWMPCSALSWSNAKAHRAGAAHKHLCADAGYRGAEHLRTLESHGYIPHVVDRRKEAQAKRRNPTKKARRWVVEVSHSWFNRLCKLLVRYEKLERSFLALNHLAAAIIALRKVLLSVNIIYGSVLKRFPHFQPYPRAAFGAV